MFIIFLMIPIAALILFVYYFFTLENKVDEIDDDIFAKDIDTSDLVFPKLPNEKVKK